MRDDQRSKKEGNEIRGFFLSQLKSWGINSVLKYCI